MNKILRIVSLMTILTYFIPVFSQQQEEINKNNKNDMSYFSQEEMQFILGDKEQPWNYASISIAPYYQMGVGTFSLILPYTTGFIVAFDHGIHHAFKPVYRKKSPFIPGLRVELAYNIYGALPVNSLSITAGVLWLFPVNHGKAGDISLSTTGGMNFMRGQIGKHYYSNDALYLTSALGYRLSFSNVFFSLEGRFSYINDKSFPWYGVGGSLGIGYKFVHSTPSESEGAGK
ncbi:MAG: hypothetical protein OEV78_04365 [Spirochaetia bacterium]|nr:hypothetical protein [Spirochaetia bacterium]